MATIDTYVISGSKATILKDPNADLDYSRDWSDWLAEVGDSIASVLHVITTKEGLAAPELTQHDSGFTGTRTVVWLAGGNVHTTYRVTARITTNSTPPRTDDRSIFVKVVQR